MSSNSTFYFQSNRRRGRSGDDDGRISGPEFSTRALMGRLAAIDEQVGILLKGDGRASSGLTHSLAAIQNELGGLAVALKELAHLREGQEGAQREMEAIRSELAAMREELTGLAPVQETLARLTRRVEGEEEVHPEESRLPRGITIEPIRPRLVLSEIDESGLESVLKLDAD